MGVALNTVLQGDCIEWLAKLQPGSVNLAFADPPFNIGYEYDVYDDRRAAEDYLDWSKQWIAGVHRALRPDGTFWLAIGDEFAAELKLIAQRDVGFHCRSWVIWYYTFGVNCSRKFTRSHVHLFHFVKDPKKFTFNADDPAIRVPSARQLVYADSRANPKGRLPDDTWILRPQDLPDGFNADGDIWFFSRVAGTFKERAGFHGCQMPERLLARIICACSNSPNDVVLDPFAGSGSTLLVAKKLNRNYLGFELSKEYAEKIRERIATVAVGQELDGVEDPLRSAPATAKGRRLKSVQIKASSSTQVLESDRALKRHVATPTVPSIAWDSLDLRRRGIAEAFRLSCDGFSVDRLIADPELNAGFIRHCHQFGLPGEPSSWNRQLLAIRKSSALERVPTTRKFRISAEEMDDYSFASEIAWYDLSEEGWSLDDILCDPALAAQFDEHARRLAPGHSSFQYRWAALRIRKRAKDAKNGARLLDLPSPRGCELTDVNLDKLRGFGGVYILKSSSRLTVYVGETFNLAERLEQQRQKAESMAWRGHNPYYVHVVKAVPRLDEAKAFFVARAKPKPLFNVPQWDWSRERLKA